MFKASIFTVSGTVGALLCAQCLVATAAHGQQLPAVSGPNGKVEFSAGVFNLPATPNFHARAAGSFSFPVTDAFGVQGDLAFFNSPSGLGVASAVHGFTRDPSSYLLGVTGAFVRVPGATLIGVGPEGELYLGQWTLEAWAGVANLNYDDPLLADKAGVFGFGDVAYYPTEDLRLSVGASHVLGYNQLRLGAEYQVTHFDMPFSVTGEGRIGQDGTVIATLGLKFYLGGEAKSLIDRHRQDDPPDREVDFFGGAGNLPYEKAPVVVPVVQTEEELCEADGLHNWQGVGECILNVG